VISYLTQLCPLQLKFDKRLSHRYAKHSLSSGLLLPMFRGLVCVRMCLSVSLSVCLSLCLSVCLSVNLLVATRNREPYKNG